MSCVDCFYEHAQSRVEFVNRILPEIQLEANDHMCIGLEVIFPTLLEDAKSLGLELAYDSAIVVKFLKERTKKLER